MVPEPDRPFGIAELAMFSAYGKDNVADALDMMSVAGLIARNVMTTAGNVGVFTFPAADRVTQLLGGTLLPDRHPYWTARFRVLIQLVDFALSPSADRIVRAAEIERLLGDIQSDLRWAATFPHLRSGVDAVNEDFEKWSIRLLSVWANIQPESSEN